MLKVKLSGPNQGAPHSPPTSRFLRPRHEEIFFASPPRETYNSEKSHGARGLEEQQIKTNSREIAGGAEGFGRVEVEVLNLNAKLSGGGSERRRRMGTTGARHDTTRRRALR